MDQKNRIKLASFAIRTATMAAGIVLRSEHEMYGQLCLFDSVQPESVTLKLQKPGEHKQSMNLLDSSFLTPSWLGNT